MKLIKWFIFFLFSISPAYLLASDLLEVYRQAQMNDPTIQAAREGQLATQEAIPQARAQFLPVLNASATHLAYHQSPGTNASAPAPQTGDTHYNQSLYGLTLTQPIFYYQQWIQLSTAAAQVKQANATYAAAEQDLIVRTVQGYFNVLKARDTLKFSKANRSQLSKILDQTQLKFKVGLIAITDVQIAKAQYDTALAEEISNENALANQKELLREITGQPIETFSFVREDLTLKSPEPADLEKWVMTAVDQNFALEAARFDAEVSRSNIKTTEAGHLPTLNINSNLNRSTSYQRTPSTTKSNVGLQVNMPLFNGGTISSKTRQAVHTYEQKQKQVETLYRKTESNTRQAYRGVLTQISQVAAQKQAIISTDSALKATEASFNVGTRTIVDVLAAQTNLVQAQQNYANARYDYIIQSVLLKQAAGTLCPEEVQHINTWLIDKDVEINKSKSTRAITSVRPS
ncbi:MAG TPA: TolC family outer membrane protein [Gammaproteobacteria bacterium]|nr:TolC family outer membrane protein [Gammaproteobacteria bacterium]HQZ87964.1 TolC family outer membrane protein [Gammaproteobacteria bacterium]HRA42454.1 TolC family outer membrane protein [Gammaproteobacteria bacterium]